MPLPDIIEIVPLAGPLHAEITVPGSKSITNRALILAALAEGKTTLHGALWSEDTQVMVECLHTLGFEVTVEADPEEFCNRTIIVKGLGGKLPRAGTAEKPLELFVGNAGTAARFLAAMVCLGEGVYRLHGVPRMHERPQAALFQALRQLGYRIDSPNDKLPAVIHGTGPNPGATCQVSIGHSSQFASALILCDRVGGWKVQVVGENTEESPYVRMTVALILDFLNKGGVFEIEPDASSGSYFWGAHWLLRGMLLSPAEQAAWELVHQGKAIGAMYQEGGDAIPEGLRNVPNVGLVVEMPRVPGFAVTHWPVLEWQVDARFPKLVPPTGESLVIPATISRNNDLGDSIMTAIVLAPFARHAIQFTDLGRLRVQECERVVALRTELTKCGAKVVEEGDTLTVYPSHLHGAEIETYNDHRMAMCFAVLGLQIPGIKLLNPACVKKTFPNFFQKLATPPPHGLGVEIRDGRTGRKLAFEELFAD